MNESSNLNFVRVPPFNSSLAHNGKGKKQFARQYQIMFYMLKLIIFYIDDDRENPDVLVEREENCCARIFYESRGKPLPGPLLVRYDVEHIAPGGEVLVRLINNN